MSDVWLEQMAEVCELGRYLLSCNVIDIEFSNGERADVYVAITPEQRQRGLSHIPSLDVDGMLFCYSESSYAPFTMAQMKMDLDLAFFDSFGKLLSWQSCSAGSRTPVTTGHRYAYVLEMPAGTFPQSDLKVRGWNG